MWPSPCHQYSLLALGFWTPRFYMFTYCLWIDCIRPLALWHTPMSSGLCVGQELGRRETSGLN